MKFLLPAITIFFWTFQLCADTVYLKTGRNIRGIISEVDSATVKISLSMGSSVFKKELIDSISMDSESANKRLRDEWNAQEIIRAKKGKFESVEFILRQLKDVYYKNEDFKLSNFYRDKKKNEVETELYELNQEYLKYNSQLKDKNYWDNPKLYSELFDKRSQIHAQIEELKAEAPDYNSADKAENQIKQTELMNSFADALNKIQLSNLDKAEKEHYFAILSEYKKITEMKEDNSVHFDYANNNSIVVKVRINDHITGRFILDTGASSVVFCESFAKKLNLDLSGIQTIQATVADGRVIEGYPVLLSSVAVGRFKSTQIGGIVLKTAPSDNIDGLLGMSYLKNYTMNLDAQAKKLYFRAK